MHGDHLQRRVFFCGHQGDSLKRKATKVAKRKQGPELFGPFLEWWLAAKSATALKQWLAEVGHPVEVGVFPAFVCAGKPAGKEARGLRATEGF